MINPPVSGDLLPFNTDHMWGAENKLIGDKWSQSVQERPLCVCVCGAPGRDCLQLSGGAAAATDLQLFGVNIKYILILLYSSLLSSLPPLTDQHGTI